MMKDVMIVRVSQLTQHDFPNNCRNLAGDLGLEATVRYLKMTFGFPWNTAHFQVVVDGEESTIEKFKSFVN